MKPIKFEELKSFLEYSYISEELENLQNILELLNDKEYINYEEIKNRLNKLTKREIEILENYYDNEKIIVLSELYKEIDRLIKEQRRQYKKDQKKQTREIRKNGRYSSDDWLDDDYILDARDSFSWDDDYVLDSLKDEPGKHTFGTIGKGKVRYKDDIKYSEIKIGLDWIDINIEEFENLAKLLKLLTDEENINYSDIKEVLNNLSQKEIEVLESYFKKRFNIISLRREINHLIKEQRKKDKIERRKQRRYGYHKDISNYDEWFDDDRILDSSSSWQDDQIFEEKFIDGITYKDLLDLAEQSNFDYGSSKKIMKIFEMLRNKQQMNFDGIKSILGSLSFSEIDILEKAIGKKFNVGSLFKEIDKIKKQQKEAKVGDVLRKFLSSKRPHTISLDPKDDIYLDDYGMRDEFADDEILDDRDLVDYSMHDEFADDEILDDRDLLEHHRDISSRKKIVGKVEEKERKETDYITGEIVLTEGFSVIQLLNSYFKKDIIQNFYDELSKIDVSSTSEYIRKSNMLIEDMLLFLSLDYDKAKDKIIESFDLQFSPNKSSEEVVKELIGDELRYYQQKKLQNRSNETTNLGTSRIIMKNIMPDEENKSTITFCKLFDAKESSYKFNTELFERNNFVIIPQTSGVTENYVNQYMVGNLFSEKLKEAEVIQGTNGKFQIVYKANEIDMKL